MDKLPPSASAMTHLSRKVLSQELHPPVALGSMDYLFGLHLNLTDRSSASAATIEPMSADEYLAVEDLVAEVKNDMFAYKNSRNIALVSMYVPLFLLAVFSNLLIVTMVVRYRRFRSATNYLLVNLALADLMVTLICMPMAVGTNIYRSWVYGYLMCKAVTYMEGVAVSASVFTLMAMSVDRYVAIRHPMIFRKTFNRTLALKVIAGVWTVSLALFIPVLLVRRTEGYFVSSPEPRFSFVFCVEKWSDEDDRRIYAAFLFAVVYAIPGHVMVAAYSMIGFTLRTDHHLTSSSVYSSKNSAFKLIKGRRKVARIMLVLALIFAFCWLPYNVVMLVLETSTNYEVRRNCFDVLPFTLLVGHSNSAINPILYCFLAKSFRNGVRETLSSCCCPKAAVTTQRPTPRITVRKSSSRYKQPTRLKVGNSLASNVSCLPSCKCLLMTSTSRAASASPATAAARSRSPFLSVDKPGCRIAVACCLVQHRPRLAD